MWLAAESGYLYKTCIDKDWQKLKELKDLSWMI
jgi:hypothetical protein